MRRIIWLGLGLAGAAALAVLMAACTGPAGPAGPPGPAGPAGPPGPVPTTAVAATVTVNIAAVPTAKPGDTVTLKATADIKDGSTPPKYQWSQTAGPKATIDNPAADSVQVKLADLAAAKAEILKNVRVAGNTRIQAMSVGAVQAGAQSTFKVVVTTSSGSYSKTINVATSVPFVATNDLADVAIGLPVMLSGAKVDTYKWSLTGPTGSTAALADAATRNPYFTPAVAGKYTIKEATSNATIEVYAGKWVGALSGLDSKNQPLSAACTGCHNGKTAPDNFTTWKATGHAGVFTYATTQDDHYGESCMSCHTVGMDTVGANNNGINDQADYAALKASGMLEKPAKGNFTTMLSQFPKSASLANIQCENCHGPNDTALHANGKTDTARISISADVCAVCHARPSNHVQVQEWQTSGHANFDTAIAEGSNVSCARCHAGQGFLAYLPQLNAGNPGSLPAAAMTWTADQTQPITCTVCHDPHDEGNIVSGEAKVRVEGDTAMLPAGFKAVAIGQGALCATCHNTRNGLHNDIAKPVVDDQAPHTAAQADVLMGENAYFVTTGIRSAHANIENTCVTCHMQDSPPPKPYTTTVNHGFTASIDICGKCHGNFSSGENLKSAVEAKVADLSAAISAAIKNEIIAQTKAYNSVILVKMGPNGTDVVITDGSTVTAVALAESHGREAMDITVGGTQYKAVRLASDTKVANGTLLTSAKGQIIAKAYWNLALVENDSSGGVHNPSFVLGLLNASLTALR